MYNLFNVPKFHYEFYFRRYIWKKYWLYFDGQKLTEDAKLLKE